MKKIFIILVGIMVLGIIPQTSNATSYQIILTSSISWDDAHQFALNLPGDWDLATITSAAEQAEINALLAAQIPNPQDRYELWIGGYYNTNWNWVSGESWGPYTNWWGGEPNNVGGIESHLALDYRTAGMAWQWNDEGSANYQIRGYVAESVPEPTTMLLFGSGLVGLFGLRKKFKK